MSTDSKSLWSSWREPIPAYVFVPCFILASVGGQWYAELLVEGAYAHITDVREDVKSNAWLLQEHALDCEKDMTDFKQAVGQLINSMDVECEEDLQELKAAAWEP